MVTRFGAYEVLYELKSGGMGAVLLARRRGPGAFEQLVAIKTILPQFASAPSVRAMFLDEAAILARLSNPGIARVYDFGEEAGTLYMVMEYVAGIPFRDLDEMRPPPAIVARAIADAARGLHAAHEARDLGGQLLGLVHRDISPDNLLLGYDGHVKVIDFGIALVKKRQAPVTEFGMVKGKPPYMSPEQVKNEAMDRRSDVFSLAVVAHEMLAHQALFDGDSIYAIARAVEHQPIPKPSTARGEELPIGMDAVIMNALDRDVARRTPTAAAFAAQLEDVVGGIPDSESLQGWVDRELEGPREAHRAWIAQVTAGRADAARPAGRPTGAVTAIGATPLVSDAHAATAMAPTSPPAIVTSAPTPDVGLTTHVGAASTDEHEAPATRRRGFAIALALLALVVGGGGIYLATRGGGATAPIDAVVASIPIDARIPVVAPVPIDAAIVAPVDAAPVVDAAPAPLDARRDVGRHHPDAAPAPAVAIVVDAAPAAAAPDAAPAGTGFVTIFHKDGGPYVQVMIDGKPAGPTPIMRKKLAAGRHAIQLLAADTSEPVFETTVVVEDGKLLTVRPP